MTSKAESTKSRLALEPSVWFFAGQLDKSEPVRHVPVVTTPFRIGRRSNLELTLPCDCVSKEHAEILDRDGTLYVRDLGSTNGTYVNGNRITGEATLSEGDIVQFATVVFRVGRERDHQTEGHTIEEDACDRALALMQFDRLLNDNAVVPFYQPIVRLDDEAMPIVAYEVLGRSRLFGLNTPREMFATASQLSLEAELSRTFRRQGVEVARRFPASVNLYVNTHPVELVEEGLIESLQDLRKASPTQPMMLEIHEAAVTKPETIQHLRNVLTDLDIGLAFDDFGAGQARLVELSEVRPDCLKFDKKLIQGLHRAPPSRQKVVELLVRMVNELEILPLAECVENKAEHEVLQQMGFRLGQGFYYGRPASISHYVPEHGLAENVGEATIG
ncbi:MAG: EAL domain-containing protein [Pirellulaceae bacterium]|nr:EAL domain-containing protein [Planctomycetales bacterium]